MAPAPIRCSKHPRERAGWHCDGCQTDLCPDCVTGSTSGTVSFVSCCSCAGQVQQLMVHRSSAPFSSRVLSVWRYPLNPSGLIAVAGLGFVLYLVPKFGCIGVLLFAGIFWGSMFAAIRHSGRGSDEIEPPDFTNLWDDLVAPAVAGLVGTIVLWLPAVVYSFYVRPKGAVLFDPFYWLMIAAGILYAPMAFIAAATNSGIGRMLNPLAIVAYIKRLGSDYLLAVGAILLLGIPGVLAFILSGYISNLPVPIVAGWLAMCVRLLVPLMMVRVLGLLLYTRGDALGWGMASDFQEPVLPGVEPRGKALPAAGVEQAGPEEGARRWAPIELDPDSSPGRAMPPIQRERHAPIELDASELPPLAATEEPAPDYDAERVLDPAAGGFFTEAEAQAAESAEAAAAAQSVHEADTAKVPQVDQAAGGPAEQLAAAVDANELQQAAKLYVEANLPEASVPAEVHLAVGQWAAGANDFNLAVRALKGAAKNPDDPLAPKALVLMARIYGEKLGNAGAAVKLFEHVLKSYPGTPAAKFAQSKLPAR
jgi:hypothetical protein